MRLHRPPWPAARAPGRRPSACRRPLYASGGDFVTPFPRGTEPQEARKAVRGCLGQACFRQPQTLDVTHVLEGAFESFFGEILLGKIEDLIHADAIVIASG